ncbi:hypothetical protein KIPB_006347 [Kipferlia bialata]|uniref:AAA ATPase AAA+ lid domain-containing protein n=1 Tax=Kipferlia bialata TaxID=797122 RepID=A0A9K3CYD2_9EUKA|nr:hypothetical protein KIPB_006347 [Kipferlia bialata]|eukprot:g6347.t1
MGTGERDWGAKTGSGAPASAELTNLARKKRLQEMADEKFDFSSDPFYFENHLGQIECKMCTTRHRSKEAYLAHRLGKGHQIRVKRYEAQMLRAQNRGEPGAMRPVLKQSSVIRQNRIGVPAYRVIKQADPETQQLSLLFEVEVCTSKMNLGDDVDLEEFVSRPDKLTGADISSIALEAGMQAVRNNRYMVNQEDFEVGYKNSVKRRADLSMAFYGSKG